MRLRLSLALAAILSLAQADVKFKSPAAGASLDGSTIDVEWADSGTAPKLSDLAGYQLFLCAGGNDPSTITVLTALTTTGDHTTETSYSATFPPTLGGTTKNAYFLKMISTATAGGTVTNYSPRFSLPDMSGTFPAAVQSALKTVSGTSGPATQNQVGAAKPPAQAAAGDFGVPYSLQTGPTRFAPAAKRPGTKITKKNPSPQYPSSAYVVFKVPAGPGDAQLTLSEPDKTTVISREPTFAAAPMPSDGNAQKLLK